MRPQDGEVTGQSPVKNNRKNNKPVLKCSSGPAQKNKAYKIQKSPSSQGCFRSDFITPLSMASTNTC